MAVSSRVALTDIAEQFGLTKVSVRKALRAHPDISSETKKPVTRKAKESVELEKRHLNTLLSMEVGGLLVSVSEGTTDGGPFQDVLDQNVPLVLFDRDWHQSRRKERSRSIVSKLTFSGRALRLGPVSPNRLRVPIKTGHVLLTIVEGAP